MLFEIDMHSDGSPDAVNDFIRFVDDNDDCYGSYDEYEKCYYQHGSIKLGHFNDLLDRLKEFGYIDKCKFSYTFSPNYYSALVAIDCVKH